MKAWAIAAALVMLPGTAAAQDWRTLGDIGDGERMSWMVVDATSVKKIDANTREVVTMNLFRARQQLPRNGGFYTHVKMTYRVDCAGNTVDSIRMVAWDGETQLFDVDPGTDPTRVNADSPLGDLTRATCGGNFAALARIGGDPVMQARSHFAK